MRYNVKAGQLKEHSTLWHVLSSLQTPQPKFHLPDFLAELEKTSGKKQSSLRAALTKAYFEGYLTPKKSRQPVLTDKAHRALKPYVPKKLRAGWELMVIFDIPESDRHLRRHLRTFLHDLGFRQSQRSVWVSDFDHREKLITFVATQKLTDCVAIYEVNRVL